MMAMAATLTFMGLANADAADFNDSIQKMVDAKRVTTTEVKSISALIEELLGDLRVRTSDKSICRGLEVLSFRSGQAAQVAVDGDNSYSADYEWQQARAKGDKSYSGRKSEALIAGGLKSTQVMANAMKYGFCDGSETTELMFGEIKTVKKGDRVGLSAMLLKTGRDLERTVKNQAGAL